MKEIATTENLVIGGLAGLGVLVLLVLFVYGETDHHEERLMFTGIVEEMGGITVMQNKSVGWSQADDLGLDRDE